MFRSAVPDRKLVSDMVEFINERMPGLKRFGFLYVNDDFGKGGFDAFVDAGKKRGMSITAEERYSRGDLDFTGQLTRIRASNPDAVVEWSRYTEGASSIDRSGRWDGTPAVRLGRHCCPAFPRSREGSRQRGYLPDAFQPGDLLEPAGGAGLHRIRAKTYNKSPDYVHAQAFDAINMRLAAIERARQRG